MDSYPAAAAADLSASAVTAAAFTAAAERTEQPAEDLHQALLVPAVPVEQGAVDPTPALTAVTLVQPDPHLFPPEAQQVHPVPFRSQAPRFRSMAPFPEPSQAPAFLHPYIRTTPQPLKILLSMRPAGPVLFLFPAIWLFLPER